MGGGHKKYLKRRNSDGKKFRCNLVEFIFGDLMKFLNLARINFGGRPIFGEYYSGKRMKKGFLGEIKASV